MFINKIFDVKLNIDNVNIIFTKDINGAILELVERKFTNKCYLSVYILNINKILNRSLIETVQSDLNGLLEVCVQFEAECITYSTGETIMNVVANNTINNIMSLSNEYCDVVMKLNKNTLEFEKGQPLIIKVGKAKFDPVSDKININAYPFIPLIERQLFYKITTISDSVKEKLGEIRTNIDVEEERKKDISKAKNHKWDHFDKLVHPYKKDISKESIKKNTTVDVFDITELQDTIISYDSEINMSNRLICKYDTAETFIECDSFEIVYDVFKVYYLHLKLINDLATTYNTDALIEKNKNIFELYIKYKK